MYCSRRSRRTRASEGVALSQSVNVATRRTVGISDIPRALVAPRKLFGRVEDVAAWGWPLLILLTAVTLIGYATVETGLIDRQVEMGVRERIARIDATQRDVVERSALRELYEQERKTGEFAKLLTRIQVVVAEPARALATVLLVSATLYGAVALTGRKPEWHTLLTICIFAGFIDLLRLLVMLALTLRFQTLEVYTSLEPLAWLLPGADSAGRIKVAVLSGLLSAVNPFRIWFWLVIIVGLSTTGQLRGWRAWAPCVLCWLLGAGGRCAIAVAQVSG